MIGNRCHGWEIYVLITFCLKLIFTFSRGDRCFDKPGQKDVGKIFLLF